jgi:hypothetical protein
MACIELVNGVDVISEMTGDFVSAVYRVMPHASEPERMQHPDCTVRPSRFRRVRSDRHPGLRRRPAPFAVR